MAGWHHQLNGHESEQTLRDGEGQRSLACCSLGVAKSHNLATEPLHCHSGSLPLVPRRKPKRRGAAKKNHLRQD